MKYLLMSFIILFISCKQNNSQNSTTEKIKDNDNYSGVYEYVSPYNTADLIENNYIVISKDAKEWKGYFYGTSDEFDDAREGYLPLFFVTELKNLSIKENKISFTLEITNDDLLTKPVELQYKTTKEAISAGYVNWDGKIPTAPKSYQGVFTDDFNIILKGDDNSLNKEFKKKVSQDK